MVDGATISAASPPAKPLLPASLVEVLDREAHPDTGWRIPDEDWIESHRGALRKALVALQHALAPAPEAFIRDRLATLATYKGSRAGVPAEWKIRAAEYLRLLGHYPPDIWQDALDQWTLANRFFPDLSELNELMLPMLQNRRRHIERIEALLITKIADRPAPAAPPAVAVWREHLEQLGGLAIWPLLERAIPDDDDGTTLRLAVERPAIGFAILAYAAPAAEAVLGRRITCIVRNWVEAALHERGIVEGGAPDTTPHRRDGEMVTLGDPAWRIWQAGRDRLAAVEGIDVPSCVFPDDAHGGALALLVPSAEVRWNLDNNRKPEIEAALGRPVRLEYRRCAGAAIGTATAARTPQAREAAA